MSKNGHLVTALSLAYVTFERTHDPFLPLAIAAFASFPDYSEGVTWSNNQRTSVIPHRTFTHWLPLYAIILALVYFLSAPWWVRDIVGGVCMASILHIVVDMFSPMGCPVANPLGPRTSFGWKTHYGKYHDSRRCIYRTGTLEEWPMIALTIGTLVWPGVVIGVCTAVGIIIAMSVGLRRLFWHHG